MAIRWTWLWPLLAGSIPLAGSSVEVIDLTPKFLDFYEAASKPGVDAETRWQLWKEKYGFAALPMTSDRERRSRALVEDAWPKYPSALERIRGGASGLRTNPQKVLDEVISALHGDAATRVRLIVFVGGFEHNAFSMGRQNGVQTIAIPVEDSDESHLIFLTHEFTHAVHQESAELNGAQTVAGVVLGEGLATRTTQQLRPGLSEERYVSAINGWLDACRQQISGVLTGMEPHLSDEGPDAVARFTLGTGTTGLHREAYCAGWFAVGRMLEDGKTLASVAHIEKDKIASELLKAMHELHQQ